MTKTWRAWAVLVTALGIVGGGGMLSSLFSAASVTEAAMLVCGTATCAALAFNGAKMASHGLILRRAREMYAEPTPDELRAPFMAVALAEVDDMKLGGPRLSAPKELPGPSLGAQLAGGWMSTGAGLANALPPANQAIANQREPEAFPAYPPGREPESVALQGQILDGWRESYRARGGRA